MKDLLELASEPTINRTLSGKFVLYMLFHGVEFKKLHETKQGLVEYFTEVFEINKVFSVTMNNTGVYTEKGSVYFNIYFGGDELKVRKWAKNNDFLVKGGK